MSARRFGEYNVKPDSASVCPGCACYTLEPCDDIVTRITSVPVPSKYALLVVCRGEDLPDYGSSAKELPNKLIGAFWSGPKHPALIAEQSFLLSFPGRTHGGAHHCVHGLRSDHFYEHGLKQTSDYCGFTHTLRNVCKICVDS